jgi:hypothetical protein
VTSIPTGEGRLLFDHESDVPRSLGKEKAPREIVVVALVAMSVQPYRGVRAHLGGISAKAIKVFAPTLDRVDSTATLKE